MLKSLRPHIGIFGSTNVGKSSFINACVEQNVSIVSDVPGTTTDPVNKLIEFGELGPVVLIDTAGLGDKSSLGDKREAVTFHTISRVDFAIVVINKHPSWLISEEEEGLIQRLSEKKVPFILVNNKADVAPLTEEENRGLSLKYGVEVFNFSSLKSEVSKESDMSVMATTRTQGQQGRIFSDSKDFVGPALRVILESIKKSMPSSSFNNPSVLGDLVSYGDLVLLVCPIDIEAPSGRLILPQVQAIRDALDNECIVVVLKERELDLFFKKYNIEPKLVVTDSQAFLKVGASVPPHIPLTSFSILFARLKGDFQKYVQGTRKIGDLKSGDRVLILESCSHHITADDIGRVKIPRWIDQYTGKKIHYDVVSGCDPLPHELKHYALVIQCGGCMLTRNQVLQRIRPFIEAGIPVTNFGMAIAFCHGIFERALFPFEREFQKDQEKLGYVTPSIWKEKSLI